MCIAAINARHAVFAASTYIMVHVYICRQHASIIALLYVTLLCKSRQAWGLQLGPSTCSQQLAQGGVTKSMDETLWTACQRTIAPLYLLAMDAHPTQSAHTHKVTYAVSHTASTIITAELALPWFAYIRAHRQTKHQRHGAF